MYVNAQRVKSRRSPSPRTSPRRSIRRVLMRRRDRTRRRMLATVCSRTEWTTNWRRWRAARGLPSRRRSPLESRS